MRTPIESPSNARPKTEKRLDLRRRRIAKPTTLRKPNDGNAKTGKDSRPPSSSDSNPKSETSSGRAWGISRNYSTWLPSGADPWAPMTRCLGSGCIRLPNNTISARRYSANFGRVSDPWFERMVGRRFVQIVILLRRSIV